MKKKIGDLTLKEIKEICETIFKKDYRRPHCTECPFHNICCRLSPDEITQKYLDQEIEVEI
jgi:hypothetical protein